MAAVLILMMRREQEQRDQQQRRRQPAPAPDVTDDECASTSGATDDQAKPSQHHIHVSANGSIKGPTA